MGAVVLRVVDGGDGLLHEADPQALHNQQHVGLVLEALPLDAAEGLQIPRRDGAQTGLRVGKADAEEQAEKTRGGPVARHGARRDAGKTEISAAEDDRVPLRQHPVSAGDDVRQQMLAVAVDGDDARKLGQMLRDIGEGRLERPALAAVDLMGQHRAAGLLRRSLKEVPVIGRAAVVHNDDMGKARVDQAVDDTRKFFVRVQRGQHDGRTAAAVRHGFRSHSLHLSTAPRFRHTGARCRRRPERACCFRWSARLFRNSRCWTWRTRRPRYSRRTAAARS